MNDKSIIAYSLPGTKEFLVGSIKDSSTERPASLSDIDFVMAPFDKSIKPTFYFRFSSISGSRVFASPSNYNKASGSSTDFASYTTGFEDIQKSFADKQTQKVVLSRRISVARQEEDLYNLFINLKNRYPQAFTYLVSTPETGTWMGASPELVISNKAGTVMTTAIAGTQAITNKNPSDIQWGSKEIEEHRYIESFLSEVLTEHKLDHTISEKGTIQAGQICHIHSRVEIETTKHLCALADLIHPGPALSGYPVTQAIDLIRSVETDPRDFYCGYIGPVQNENTKWFANIRCLQVHKDHYTLYVGGGITKDSVLEAEWEETRMKSMTLLSVLELAETL